MSLPIVGQPNSSNGNGSYFRLLLPLWLFLAVQAGTGIWWMATISADVRALMRSQEDMIENHKVLDLQQQRLDREFARFEERMKFRYNREGSE